MKEDFPFFAATVALALKRAGLLKNQRLKKILDHACNPPIPERLPEVHLDRLYIGRTVHIHTLYLYNQGLLSVKDLKYLWKHPMFVVALNTWPRNDDYLKNRWIETVSCIPASRFPEAVRYLYPILRQQRKSLTMAFLDNPEINHMPALKRKILKDYTELAVVWKKKSPLLPVNAEDIKELDSSQMKRLLLRSLETDYSNKQPPLRFSIRKIRFDLDREAALLVKTKALLPSLVAEPNSTETLGLLTGYTCAYEPDRLQWVLELIKSARKKPEQLIKLFKG